MLFIECACLRCGFLVEDWPVYSFCPSAPNLDVPWLILEVQKMFRNNFNGIAPETRPFFIDMIVSLNVTSVQRVGIAMMVLTSKRIGSSPLIV
jgi:hypothetical protein